MRVIAAMSGGVDSAVAAARIIDAGHEVVGVHLALARSKSGSRGCCTLDDARDARRVADMLGIPFYVWDLSERFATEVIEDFVDEYRQGRTPNPCIRCNERIKFAAVLERAVALGFDAVATGHYARVVAGSQGPELHRAQDSTKDQSYVLGVLQREQLERTLLPLGGNLKEEVRAEAAQRGLLVARKPDSHDICFIPDGDTAAFLRSRLGEQPGDIIDVESGAVLGQHDGAFGYTVGQRRGLDLRVPASDGKPRYVVATDVAASAVLVGPPTLLDIDHIEASQLTWTGLPLHGKADVTVQVRAHGDALPARAAVVGSTLIVELTHTLRGLASGQSVVVYDGTRVLGSGIIDRVSRRIHA